MTPIHPTPATLRAAERRARQLRSAEAVRLVTLIGAALRGLVARPARRRRA